MRELLEVAVRAARAGGAVVSEAHRSRRFTVSEKGRADFVTEVDVASERAIGAVIREAFEGHVIVGEEGVDACPSDSEWCWVVDPLDGTTNFIHDIPFFGVSIGVERRGVPVVGVVLNPVRDELYTACAGEGAWRGGRRLRVSTQAPLSSALVLTGIPFRNIDVMPLYLPGFERIARGSQGIRRMGSAALDLCAIAAGRAEAFWEFGLSRWDVSAGSILVTEAGGRVTDFFGADGYLATGDIVASNGSVHDEMLRCIARG